MNKKRIRKIVVKLTLIALISAVFALFIPAPQQHTNTDLHIKSTETSYQTAHAQPAESAEKTDDKKTDETTDNKAGNDGEYSEGIMNSMRFLLWLQDFLNSLLWPILVIIGGLMDNSLLFGNGMEERLREIWIPIRNLVNILFVVGLIGVALYNVLGLGDEGGSYSLKKILPNIILGIIAVNFSFLAIKVFLDVINVLTVSIFALPDQVSEGLSQVVNAESEEDKETIKRFCLAKDNIDINEYVSDEKLIADKDTLVKKKAYEQVRVKYDLLELSKISDDIDQYISNQSDPKLSEEYENAKKAFDANQLCVGTKLTPVGEAFLSKYKHNNAALAMALTMGKVVFYEDLDFSVKNVPKIIVSNIFSLVMYFVFVASFLALFVVLLGRLVVMWISIAISPIILLAYAVPAFKENIPQMGSLLEKFIKNAIAPLGIALSMSIGWIMLGAIASIDSPDGNIKFEMGIPVASLSTLQDVVVALGTIAVVWLGVFTAAEDTVAGKFTNFLKESVASAGKFLGTMPLKHFPIIPIDVPGAEGNYTPQQVLRAVQGLKDTAANENKLLNDITGVTSTGKDYLLDKDNIKDAKDLTNWMYTNRNMSAEDMKKALQDFQKTEHGGKIIRGLTGEKEKVVKGMLNANKDNIDERYKALKEHVNRSNPTEIKPEPTKKSGQTGQETQTTPGLKKDSDFGTGKGLNNAKEEQLRDVNKNLNQLNETFKKAPPNQPIDINEAKTLLGQVYYQDDAGTIHEFTSAQQVEKAMDPAAYENLVKSFGSDQALDKYLKGRPTTTGGGAAPGAQGGQGGQTSQNDPPASG